MYESKHWNNICRHVADVCFPIFPHLRKKSVRSAVMSNVFESQAETYFLSNGIRVKSSRNDRDPDLLFLEHNVPCEIKVTGIDQQITDKCVTWLGGRFSKRSCDYVFIVWNYSSLQTLYGESELLSFAVIKSVIREDDWKELSNSKDYYGLGLKSHLFQDRDYQELVGNFKNGRFQLTSFERIHRV